MIAAVIASAMAVMFVLHSETDSSSAEITDYGRCGPDAYYMYFSDGSLEIFGTGSTYDYNYAPYAPWYDYRKDIKSITISEDITHLGAWTFVKCKNVTELTIPITLNSVGSDQSNAFAGCVNIQKINFTYGSDGYGYNYDAYKGSDSWYQNTPWYQSKGVLKEINFVDGIVHIGNDAFRELELTAVTIPDSVTSLGNHCFFNCTKLTDLTIPMSLNSYGNADYPAFAGCMAVEKVTFTRGNGVAFDYSDWRGIYNLSLAPWNLNPEVAKTIVISEDITKLGRYMFWYTNIKELTIPVSASPYYAVYTMNYSFKIPYDSLEKVTITEGDRWAYDYNSRGSVLYVPWNKAPNLKTVIVEEGVTRLGSYAFNECQAETIILPNSLVSLGENTFLNCKVKNLTIPISLNAVWLDKDSAFEGVTGVEKVTFVPGTGNGFNYAASEGNNCLYQKTPWYQSRNVLKELVLEEGIKSIGSDAFRELNIESLVLPETVGSLGNHCFFNCTELTELTLPISLNPVGNVTYPAFSGCMAIDTVSFTRGNWVPFDYTTFWGKVDYELLNQTPWNLNPGVVKNIILAGNIRTLGVNMFCGCNIGYLEISIETDCGQAFYDTEYSSLKSVHFIWGWGVNYGYATAGLCPWNNAENLEEITMESGINYVGSFTFYGCKAESIVLPYTLNSFGIFSFAECTVKNLTISPGANTVGRADTPAFYHVSGIEKLTFDSGTYSDGMYGYKYSDCFGNSYYQLTPWYLCRDTLKEVVIEGNLARLGSNTLRDLNITSIVIPDCVRELGEYALYNCSKLTDLTIPITLNSIGSGQGSAFGQCNAITNLRFTAGSNGIGVDYTYCAPSWCTPTHKAVQITIDDGVKYIGNQAFAGYCFVGSDGEILEHTAECMSGHTFTKTNNGSYVIDNSSDCNKDISAMDGLTEIDSVLVPIELIRIPW